MKKNDERQKSMENKLRELRNELNKEKVEKIFYKERAEELEKKLNQIKSKYEETSTVKTVEKTVQERGKS